MEITLTLKDDISAALQSMADDLQRADTMEAVGHALVSLTRRAFDDASLRPATWPARGGQDSGGHALLKKSGTLQRSIRVTTHTANSVSVGSDRVYAAIHQFGGTIHAKAGPNLTFKIGDRWISKPSVTIPARPFFPLTSSSGQLTSEAEDTVKEVYRIKLRKYGVKES